MDPDAPASLEDGLFGLGNSVDEARVVVIPVPFEATTSYRQGTALAPARVLEASLQVDLHDLETGPVYEAGVAMLEAPDWGRPQRERVTRSPTPSAPGCSKKPGGSWLEGRSQPCSAATTPAPSG